MVKFYQKVTGAERKNIAAVISEATGKKVEYAGVPSYAYKVGDYSLDKDGVIQSPKFDNIDEVKKVLDALDITGLNAEEKLTIIISADAHTEESLMTLNNLISSKANLLKKSLSLDEEVELSVTADSDEVRFDFFNATINFDELKAYVSLADKLNQQSLKLKYCSAKEKEVDNEKYALRCFLLRLGFIGNEYKTERKILLKNVSGNSAFRNVKEKVGA